MACVFSFTDVCIMCVLTELDVINLKLASQEKGYIWMNRGSGITSLSGTIRLTAFVGWSVVLGNMFLNLYLMIIKQLNKLIVASIDM